MMLIPIYHLKNEIEFGVRKTIRNVYDYEFCSGLRDVEIMKIEMREQIRHVQYETYIKLLVEDANSN